MAVSIDSAGLHVGQTHMSLVRLVEREGELHPLFVAQVGLPKGTFDEEGHLLRPELITKGAKQLVRESKPRTRNVRVALGGSLLEFSLLSLDSNLTQEERQAAVYWELIYSLPWDADDAHITHQVLEEHSVEEKVSVLAVACQKQASEGLANALSKGGMVVEAIEPEPTVLPLSVDVGRDPDRSELLLSIGATRSVVMIVRDSKVRYVEKLPMGGDDFTQELCQLGHKQGVAEHFKRHHHLVGPKRNDPYAPERNKLIAVANRLSEGLHDAIAYEDQGSIGRKERLVICGGGAMLQGLAGHLRDSLGLSVEKAEPVSGLNVENPDQFPRQATAYALAMPVPKGSA